MHSIRSSFLPAALYSLVTASRRDRHALVSFRNIRMRILLEHAYNNVAYYRDLFDKKGIKPRDIRTTEDLPAIPVTYKKDLQSLPPDKLIDRTMGTEKLITHRSSGSTGEPFTTRRTWMEERLLQTFRRRAYYFFGQKPWHKAVGILRVRPDDPNDHQFLLRIANAVGLYQMDRIDCFLPFSEIIRQLQQNRYEILGGLSSVLYHLALHINQNGLIIDPPRFITCGGEVLKPHMRKEIEAAFGARVYDIYGCHEFNMLAWQCRETGEYHICDDAVIVEVLRDGRPARTGEIGDVIATSLFSYAMPFIRYHVGDIVVLGSDRCGCGAAFSTIRDIQGRTMDYVALEDGRRIHPYQIIRFLVHSDKSWVRQYQLIQEDMNRITLKIATFRTAEQETLRKLEKDVRAILGESALFRIEIVDAIQREESGKFKVFKSFTTSSGN